MYHFEKLEIWQKAMELVDKIYDYTETFPVKEKFALCDQIRRAVVSIPINIAEGAGRNSKREFVQFLMITRGSLYEVITLLMIARRRGYLPEDSFKGLLVNVESIGKMLSKLIASMRTNG